MIRFIVFLLLIFTSNPVLAQEKNAKFPGKATWNKDGIVINDSQGRSIKQNVKVVALSDGNVVMVWEDDRNGYANIYAQKMDSGGMKLWGEKGVPVCTAPKAHTIPQIVAVGSSEVVIAWQDYRNDACNIYAQKLDNDGNPVWTVNGVAAGMFNANQFAPQLAADGSGGAIITWYDYRGGMGEDIYAQRINSAGVLSWTQNGIVVSNAQGTQWYPQIASDNAGGAVICWEDKRNGNYDIYAQRLDGKGNSYWLTNGIAICIAPENQQTPQITQSGTSDYTIVWQDYRNGKADVYAQRLDNTGRTLWENNGKLVCNVAGNQEHPVVTGGSEPIIAWVDFRNGSSNSDIFAQKLSADGIPLWDQYGVDVCSANGNQGNPRIAADGMDGAIVVWEDERTGTKGISARGISKDGKPQWAPDGKTICVGADNAEFPQVAVLENGNAVYVWQDKRNGGLEVFAQSTNPLGVNIWKANGIDIVFGFGSVTQQKPKLAKTGVSEYVVAFEDYRNGFSNIYAQKFNNAGKLLWGTDGIRVSGTPANQLNPEIISDDKGGAIIVWEDSRNDKTSIYAQRVDSSGNSLWDQNGILICQTNTEKTGPKICKDGKNGAIIVWQEVRNQDNISRIFAQRVDGNGSLLWNDIGIELSNSSGTQTGLKMASDGESGAIIAWVEYRGNINNPDIYAQRVSPKGAVMWGPQSLAVCKAPSVQRNPDIAANNEIVIGWEDAGGGNYDIYAQKVNKDGSVAWTCDGVPICTAPNTQREPRITLSGDGGAIMVWEDYRSNDWDIYAQRVSAEGSVLWQKDGVPVIAIKGTQYAPQIVKGRNGSALIVWEDYRNNKSYSIYAQKLSTDGKTLWDPEGLPICITDGGSRNPQIVDDNEGGAIVVWTDFRYGGFDIYAQRIND